MDTEQPNKLPNGVMPNEQLLTVLELLYDGKIRPMMDAALEVKAQEIRHDMYAHLTAFQQDIRMEVRQDHAENRARLKDLADQATRAASSAALAAADSAKTAAGTDYIVKRLDEQDEKTEKNQSLMLDLLGEVRSITGRSAGIAEAEARQEAEKKKEDEVFDKRMGRAGKIAAWAAGLLATGGAGKWLMAHLKLLGGK